MPQNSNFWLLRGHRFGQKIEFTGKAPNHGGDPLGSILGPMGSHWGQKMGQNRQKLPCSKIRIFYYSAVIDLSKKSNLRLWPKNHGGEPLGSILGPMGSHWDQKMCQTVKNYNAPKFEFLTTPRSHRFGKKIELMVMAPNHSWDTLGSILGPMGSHWGQKMGQNRKKLPCPKIRIFYYSAVIDLGKKSNLQLWRQFMVGTTYGTSWGQWGPIGPKKMGQNRQKLLCPKIRSLTTPPSSIWAKNRINGYGAKSRWGTPRVLLGANGVPLGPKKRVKTVKITMPQNKNFWLLHAVIDLGKKSNLWLWQQITVGTP